MSELGQPIFTEFCAFVWSTKADGDTEHAGTREAIMCLDNKGYCIFIPDSSLTRRQQQLEAEIKINLDSDTGVSLTYLIILAKARK